MSILESVKAEQERLKEVKNKQSIMNASLIQDQQNALSNIFNDLVELAKFYEWNSGNEIIADFNVRGITCELEINASNAWNGRNLRVGLIDDLFYARLKARTVYAVVGNEQEVSDWIGTHLAKIIREKTNE